MIRSLIALEHTNQDTEIVFLNFKTLLSTSLLTFRPSVC